MQASLRVDTEKIRNTILTKNALHFSNIDLGAEEMYGDIERVLKEVRALSVMRKADDKKRSLIRTLVDLKEKLDLKIKENEDA